MISSHCGELSENPESYLLKIKNKIKISRKKILYFIFLFIIISFILRMEIECVFHYRNGSPGPARSDCRIKLHIF